MYMFVCMYIRSYFFRITQDTGTDILLNNVRNKGLLKAGISVLIKLSPNKSE